MKAGLHTVVVSVVMGRRRKIPGQYRQKQNKIKENINCYVFIFFWMGRRREIHGHVC